MCIRDRNGEAYIKKLKDDKDGIFLISLNEKYAPIKVGENDRLDIFGKVLGKSNASAITGHCLSLIHILPPDSNIYQLHE